MHEQPKAAELGVDRIRKSFPGLTTPVLDGVSFDVRPGQFLSIIGPSGCGKTTLLRIIAGIEKTDSGSVMVGGRESVGPSKEKALVFQQFNLFPWRTALDNAAYGLQVQGAKKGERRSVAREYLQLVGLEEFAGAYPHQLSGGMQQRVGLARALAVQPKVLLLDEPFGALDALTRESLQGELERICSSAGATVVLVTHSIDEAIFLSDQVIVMGRNPGRIVRQLDVALPRPRSGFDTRGSEQFVELRGEVWQSLAVEMDAVRSESHSAPSFE